MQGFRPVLRCMSIIELAALARGHSVASCSRALGVPRTTLLFGIYGQEFPRPSELGRLARKLDEYLSPVLLELGTEGIKESFVTSYVAESAIRRALADEAHIDAASLCAAEILRRHLPIARPFDPPAERAATILSLYRQGLSQELEEGTAQYFLGLMAGYVLWKAKAGERYLETPKVRRRRGQREPEEPPPYAEMALREEREALLPEGARLKNAALFDVLLSFVREVSLKCYASSHPGRVECACDMLAGETASRAAWHDPFGE